MAYGRVLWLSVFAIGLAGSGVPSSEAVTFTVQGRYLIDSHYTTRIGGIGLAPDGGRLFVAYWGDTSSDLIQEYATTNFVFQHQVGFGTCHGDVVVSSDGRYFFAPTYYQGTVSRWDRQNGYTRLDRSAGQWPATVAMNPSRTRLLAPSGSDGQPFNQGNDAIYVYDISGNNFTQIAAVSLPDEPTGRGHPDFSPDGAFAYFTTHRKWQAGAPDRLYEFSMTSNSVTNHVDLVATAAHTSSVVVAGDRLFVEDHPNAAIRIFNRTGLTPAGSWALPGSPSTLRLHPNGTDLYVLFPSTGSLRVYDVTTGQQNGQFDDLQIDAGDIEFSPDGQTAWISGIGNRNGIVVLGISPSTTEVAIDIRPGDCPNPFNRTSRGVLPVALIGTADFDVTRVNLASVRLRRADGVGQSVAPQEGPPGPHSTIADLTGPAELKNCQCAVTAPDGVPDLKLHFRSENLTAALGLGTLNPGALVELVVTGSLVGGGAFEGRDCIRLVPPGSPPGLLEVSASIDRTWIDSSPRDLQLDGGGFASFQRTFPHGTLVTLGAPSSVNGRSFVGWQVNGAAVGAGAPIVQLWIDGGAATARAIYASGSTGGTDDGFRPTGSSDEHVAAEWDR
jgi:DNA-binding beta-propeller fold protein YncE